MLYASAIFHPQCTRQNSIKTAVVKQDVYNQIFHRGQKKSSILTDESISLSLEIEKKRERRREKTQVECLSIGETTRVFFRVETFDSASEDAKNLYLSVFLFFLSLSILANCRHLRPHLPSRSVLRRGGKYLSWLPPTPASSSRPFFVKYDPRASEELLPEGEGKGGRRVGPYRPLLLDCGKPRPGYGREDLIKTKRNEPRKTTGVHLSESRGSGLLFLRSSFYLAISGLCFGPTDLWRPLSSYLTTPSMFVLYAAWTILSTFRFVASLIWLDNYVLIWKINLWKFFR